MLTIKVLSYKDVALDTPITAEFGETGGTIGRSPESTLLLPDPDRIISQHARHHRHARRALRSSATRGTTVRVARRTASHPAAARTVR